MTDSIPRVTVVVPVYQGEQVLPDCLRSVFDQTYPRDLYEVLIVDNGSTDRSAEIARDFPTRIVEEIRKGVAFARNTGVEKARGELIAFVDADCIAEPNWLEALVARYDAEDGLAGVGGHIPGYDPQTPIQYFIADRNLLRQEDALLDQPYSAPFLITANALLNRELILKVGGLDTSFPTNGEDADLCWRIADLGYHYAFAPEAVVYHRHRSSVRAFCKWMYRYGKESVYLQKKHKKRFGIGPVMIDFVHYGRWLAAIGRFLAPWPLEGICWERRFAGYDILRFTWYTAGRIAGSIKYRSIML